jgi:hypothetical protein
MKIMYEISDVDNDRFNYNIHKYADDMYFALLHIDEILRAERKEHTTYDKEKLIDLISEEIYKSNFNLIE